MPDNKFDFIIAGAGLSGFTMAIELLKSSLKHKSILLIDQDKKDKNDRTWCFWATPQDYIPDVKKHYWKYCKIFVDDFEKRLSIEPYEYSMIRGIDFYNHALQLIKQHKNVKFITDKILSIDNKTGIVKTENGIYEGELIFKSYFKINELSVPDDYTWLLQHFKGWFIETDIPYFKKDEMTFMDFRTNQHNETRFFYVLPFSENKALIEYTIFSPEKLEEEQYDIKLADYIKDTLKIENYKIVETEFYAIPMTDFPFHPKIQNKVVHIGTLGSFVKGSSGYIFKRSQDKIFAIIKELEKKNKVTTASYTSKLKYRFYDSILLYVMQKKLVPAKDIFKILFQKLPDNLLFKFLDEKTSLLEDLKIILICPPIFMIAFLKQLKRISKI